MDVTTKVKRGGSRTSWAELRPQVTDELLADITRRIVEKFDPYTVILFGSYAWGKPQKDSDIDLLVVMDSDERPAKRGMLISPIARVPFVPMDLLVYTPQEIEDRLTIGDFFVREIMEKGKVLYKRVAG
jgi:predicted nucleotidyltransferase